MTGVKSRIARGLLALIYGIVVYWFVYTAGNYSGAGLQIYILLFRIVGVPTNDQESDRLFVAAALLLGLLALWPAVASALNFFRWLQRPAWTLKEFLLTFTWIVLVVASVFLFRDSENQSLGLIKFAIFLVLILMFALYASYRAWR